MNENFITTLCNSLLDIVDIALYELKSWDRKKKNSNINVTNMIGSLAYSVYITPDK